MSDKVIVSGSLVPSSSNSPLDYRTRINSLNEVEGIQSPFIGMIFYAIEEDEFYVVKSLKAKTVGSLVIENAIIDRYENLINIDSVDMTNVATKDFVNEQIAQIELTPGPEGPAGKDFTYDMFTEDQLAALKGKDGAMGLQGQPGKDGIDGKDGVDGADGKSFTYDMFTEEQLADLKGDKGDKGDPFRYEDFTEDQLAALKGQDGVKGDRGPAGKDFTYEMFTAEQLEALRGPEGKPGKDADPVNLEGYATEEYVQDAIKNIQVGEEVDLSDFAKISYVDEQIANIEHYDDTELRELIDEQKPYLADVKAYPTSKFLFACGQPMTVEPNVGHKYSAEHAEDAVAFVYRWAEGFECIMVDKAEAEKVYLVGGYGHECVGAKRAIPQTNMVVRNVKIKGLVGGNYFEGMVGHVNIEAENCEFVSVIGAGWCGASVNGSMTRMNIADDINIKMTNCKISSTFFGGAQGNGVADDVHIELNNCEIGWLTAGGANGMTRNAVIEMNGGKVKVAQSTNRGIVFKARFILNDGEVEKLYFGGETEDATVNGMIEDGFVELNGGIVKQFNFGTDNGIEMAAENIKGCIMDCVVENGDISMLEVKVKEEQEQVDLSGYAKIEFVEEQIANIELKEGPAGQDGQPGKDGEQGPAGQDGISIVNVAIENNHLMITLSNEQVLDAGEFPAGQGGGAGEEVTALQAELNDTKQRLLDLTYGVDYEWVYFYNQPSAGDKVHFTEENAPGFYEDWKPVYEGFEAGNEDAYFEFIERMYAEDIYRMYVMKIAEEAKFCYRYELLPLDGHEVQPENANLAEWNPVARLTSWNWTGDALVCPFILDSIPTSPMTFALLKVKK